MYVWVFVETYNWDSQKLTRTYICHTYIMQV